MKLKLLTALALLAWGPRGAPAATQAISISAPPAYVHYDNHRYAPRHSYHDHYYYAPAPRVYYQPRVVYRDVRYYHTRGDHRRCDHGRGHGRGYYRDDGRGRGHGHHRHRDWD
jgi:hypothetical protein